METKLSIEGLVGSISDTLTAGWPESDPSCPTSDPELLANLRIIEQVAQAHTHILGTATTHPQLPFGTWGHLRLLERVGQGSYGEVFRAWDPNLNVEVALKLFHVDATSVSFLEREELMEEARTLARLRQENVVRVHGADIHQGRVGFWMEFVLGEPLSEDLAGRGAKDADEVAILGIKMSKALAAAHAAGVLHRDIKPSNVVRETGGHLYLMDFGAGTLLKEPGSMEAQRIGTPLYMAPEVLFRGQSSPQSDIYSLGVLLFHALTLRHPYEGKTIQELAGQHQRGDRLRLEELRPGLPRELRAAVDRCLSSDPRARYSRATDLADELAAILVPADRVRARPTWLTWAFGALSVLLLATRVPWSRVWDGALGTGATPTVRSVAVLSFESDGLISEEATYLALGIGSHISDRLTDLEQVRVVPWVSSKRYRSGEIEPREAADLLGVEALVVGSLVTHGDEMSGSVSLVGAESGDQLWSYAIEGDREDILRIEREILEELGRAISGKLTPPERQALAKPAARSVAAYELYLKGVLALQESTEAGDDRAYELFRRALEIDPQSVPALVGSGAVHLDRYFFGWRGGASNLDQAETFFRQALTLDPDDTYAVQGICHALYEKHRGNEGVDLALQYAIGHPDDPEALTVFAHTCALAGFTGIACDLLDIIVRRDPADVSGAWVRVVALAFDGRYEAAIAAGEDYFLRFGENAEVHTWVGFSYMRLGQDADARIHLERASGMTGSAHYAALFVVRSMAASGDLMGAARLASDHLHHIERSLAAYPDNERLQFYALYLRGILDDQAGIDRTVLTNTPVLEAYRDILRGDNVCKAVQSVPLWTANTLLNYFPLPTASGTRDDVELPSCIEEKREALRRSEAHYVRAHASDLSLLGLSPSS